MGSQVELNDTLQITEEQGFPARLLDLPTHLASPISLESVKRTLFSFKDKPGPRIFQSDPVRVYLVHNIRGKWLFWGHALIQSQAITKQYEADGTWAEKWVTSGTYVISKLFEPWYQEAFTRSEAPSGKSYF